MAHEKKPVRVRAHSKIRNATWEQSVGIWVPGHDINVGDEVEIEGSSYEVRTMSRLVKESEPWTIIKKAEWVEGGG